MFEVSPCNASFHLQRFSWEPAYRYTCCRKLSLIQTLPADQGQLHVCPLHAQNAQSWAAQRGQKAAQELLGYQPLSCVCSGLIEWDWVKHTQSNAPRLCPSLTLAKNAPVEVVLLCFCVFASEVSPCSGNSRKEKDMKKLAWGLWEAILLEMMSFYSFWTLRVWKKHSHTGISLYAQAANVHLHRYQSFNKREHGGASFLMKVKMRPAINFSVVRTAPLVTKSIPRQILPQGTCHLPFPCDPWRAAAAFGEQGLAGAPRLETEPDTSQSPAGK